MTHLKILDLSGDHILHRKREDQMWFCRGTFISPEGSRFILLSAIGGRIHPSPLRLPPSGPNGPPSIEGSVAAGFFFFLARRNTCFFNKPH